MNYQQIKSWAETHIKTRDNSKQVFNIATVSMDDGSFFQIMDAYIIERQGWILVFSRSYRYFILDKEQVNTYYETHMV